MDHFIESIDIQNFKSIRQLHIAGLNRINLLIGRPNVGKSNILEALGLFSLPYVRETSTSLTDFVRAENSLELFFDGDSESDSEVRIYLTKEPYFLQYQVQLWGNKGDLEIKFLFSTRKYLSLDYYQIGDHENYTFNSSLKLVDWLNVHPKNFDPTEFVKSYTFRTGIKPADVKQRVLLPPFGSNLLYSLEFLPELRETFGSWFKRYGLKLALDRTTHSLKVLKDKGNEVFILPYSSIADTLQRVIFYKTAIRSNENSVLIFEEPEAHAYPQYISEFTQDVINSTTNQFFIATHSPFIVNGFLDDAIDELSILMVDFEDGQTIVRALSKEELYEVRRYGIDLFFNGDQYLH